MLPFASGFTRPWCQNRRKGVTSGVREEDRRSGEAAKVGGIDVAGVRLLFYYSTWYQSQTLPFESRNRRKSTSVPASPVPKLLNNHHQFLSLYNISDEQIRNGSRLQRKAVIWGRIGGRGSLQARNRRKSTSVPASPVPKLLNNHHHIYLIFSFYLSPSSVDFLSAAAAFSFGRRCYFPSTLSSSQVGSLPEPYFFTGTDFAGAPDLVGTLSFSGAFAGVSVLLSSAVIASSSCNQSHRHHRASRSCHSRRCRRRLQV
ncbi:hypothetical protein LXL04_017164 [Taraxacum kok-saghyz]